MQGLQTVCHHAGHYWGFVALILYSSQQTGAHNGTWLGFRGDVCVCVWGGVGGREHIGKQVGSGEARGWPVPSQQTREAKYIETEISLKRCGLSALCCSGVLE